MLEKLYNLITCDIILKKDMFKFDLGDALDKRYSEPFESKWLEVFGFLDKGKYDHTDIKYIDKIRELSFLKAYRNSKSDDLAALISDDFEIIPKAFIIRCNNPWLNSVANSYLNNIFPCGNIEESTLDIDDIIDRYIKASL